MLAKKDLVDGAYYNGTCRNASVARWNATEQKFWHWRVKFGNTYTETLRHPDDEDRYDVFTPESLCSAEIEIPFD